MISPCDAVRLDLRELLPKIQLAALPQSAVRLLELSRQDGVSAAEFALPIESDPGLAGQVLKFVNSSYFGFVRKISSVKDGISLVGIRTIKNFALWNAVFSLIPNPKCGQFDLKCLWQDSLRRALFGRAVAKLQGLKTCEDVFSAALLQDMAVPLLAKELPQLYVKLFEARQDGLRQLSSLEFEVMGWTHANAAGILARQWNLPEEFAAMIEGHANFTMHPDSGRFAQESRIVALSALLPSTVDLAWVECTQWKEGMDTILAAGHPSWERLLDLVDQEFSNFAPVMKIASPRKPLRESLREVEAVGDNLARA